MKIGIDARMINHSGIGTYIRNLVSCYGKYSGHEFVLFGNAKKLEKYNLPVAEADFPIYSIGEQALLPLLIKASGVDLFHCPHYNIPVFSGRKIVTTVHDIIHYLFPQYLASRTAYYYAKILISKACGKSEQIIADSENTKNDIIKNFKISGSKITVIYPSVDPMFTPLKEKTAPLKTKYGSYILYVGAIREHKNVASLVKSFCELKKKHSIKQKLLLVGKEKPDYYRQISGIVGSYGLNDEVITINCLKTEELPLYYSEADLFVFPTFYEGFGLPPLEAMACACPVVSSNTSSLPEVVGDAGLMIDPYNQQELENTIYKALSDEALKKQLVQKGLERVKLFTQDKLAENTFTVYNKAFVNN